MLRMDVPETQKSFENFSRLWELIMIVCTELFREVLSYYIRPSDERLEAHEHIGRLNKVLYGLQRKFLSPMKKQIPLSLTDIEFEMLFKILRKIGRIPFSSAWGKDPQKGDRSIGACIKRIRFLTNMLAHTNGTVDDDEFEYYWAELRDAIVLIEEGLIGGDEYRLKIESLRTKKIFASPVSNQEKLRIIQASKHSAVVSTSDEKERETEVLFDMVSRKLSASTPFFMFFGELGQAYSEKKTFKETKDSECYFLAMYEWYQMYPDIDHKEKLISILSALERQDIIDSINDFTEITFQEFDIHNECTSIDERDMRLVCEYETRYFRHLLRYLGLRQYELDSIEIDYGANTKKTIFVSLKKLTSHKVVTRIDLCSAIEYASQNRLLIKKLNSEWEPT